MSVSTRTRFEIFKRDGFRCQYCGATPVASPLHVDHVLAKANGGTDDPSNLLTACAGCNLGKSSVRLDKNKFPARDPEGTEEQAKQIKSYLKHQKEIVAAKREMILELEQCWNRCCITGDYQYLPQDFRPSMMRLIDEFSFAELLQAIEIAGGSGCYNSNARWRYFHGVLRNWRRKRNGEDQ